MQKPRDSLPGDLLLTLFIQFLSLFIKELYENPPGSDKVLIYKRQEKEWKSRWNNMPLVHEVLSRPPAAHMKGHAEEVNSLAYFSDNIVPAWIHEEDDDYIVDLARCLLARGASIDGIDLDGCKPVELWCMYDNISSAKGLVMLLEAGATLDAGCVQALCEHNCVQALRELSSGGWLQLVNMKLIDQGDETPMQQLLQTDLGDCQNEHAQQQMLQLLSTEEKCWHSHVRPAVLALLGCHEQLIPDLADLIVSYIK